MKKAISWIPAFVLLLPLLGCSSGPAASITYSMKINPEFEISASDGLVVVHVAAKNADSFNGYNWCPCCWGSGVEGTGDPDYRNYYPDPTE